MPHFIRNVAGKEPERFFDLEEEKNHQVLRLPGQVIRMLHPLEDEAGEAPTCSSTSDWFVRTRKRTRTRMFFDF